jgi:hypothetical protein
MLDRFVHFLDAHDVAISRVQWVIAMACIGWLVSAAVVGLAHA